MHSTSNLEDNYIGSGKRLWLSIRKHGRENHMKEILEFLEDRNALKAREKEIVNKMLLKDLMCMNLIEGGEGGFNNELIWTGRKHSTKTKEKFSITHLGEKNSQFGKVWVHNHEKSAFIHHDFLDDYISKGWERGRICPRIKESKHNYCMSCVEELYNRATYCSICTYYARFKGLFKKLEIVDTNLGLAKDNAILKIIELKKTMSLSLIRKQFGIQQNSIDLLNRLS